MFTKLADSRAISTIEKLRFVLATLFFLAAVAIVIVKIPGSRGATPASGSVSESNTKVTWTGQIKPASGSSDCGSANNSGCDNFGVNFQAPASSYGPYLLEIKLQPQGDLDMQVYGPNGNLVDGSGNSPGVVELVTLINPLSGNYVVAAAPFAPWWELTRTAMPPAPSSNIISPTRPSRETTPTSAITILRRPAAWVTALVSRQSASTGRPAAP